MRILLLYYSPWWNATAYYGVTLAEGLKMAGHSVWLGTSSGNPAWNKAGDYGIDCYPIKLQANSPFTTAGEIRKLAKFVREQNIDLINTLSPQGHLFHLLGTKLFGLKVPLVRTCCDVREPNSHLLNKYMYRDCVDSLIFPCRSNMTRYMDILKFPEEKSSVIYPAINLKRFDGNKPPSGFRERFGIPENIPVIGNAARLSPEKGHIHFLKTAAKVIEKIKDVRFVIAGKEEQVSIESLQTTAKELGISDKVIFTGYMDDPRGMMDECSLGFITSRFSETVSRAALEFFSSGKPVVASRVNILGEIIKDGENGFTYNIDDVDGTAGGILRILEEKELYNRMSENARRNVLDFYEINRFTEKTLFVFKEILKRAGNDS